MAETFIPLKGGAGATSAAPAGSSASCSLESSAPQVRLLWVPTSAGTRCQVRWGKGTQTALTTDMQLVENQPEAFSKGDADTLAVIGTGTLYVISGHGN
jgi:hypothetical protein